MDLIHYKDEKYDKILCSMEDYLEYIEDNQDTNCFCPGYSHKDIKECGNILDNYIDNLIEANQNIDKILDYVEKVIINLNDLNEKSNYTIIESEQREYLCDFIQELAIKAGLPFTDKDITKEWRF